MPLGKDWTERPFFSWCRKKNRDDRIINGRRLRKIDRERTYEGSIISKKKKNLDINSHIFFDRILISRRWSLWERNIALPSRCFFLRKIKQKKRKKHSSKIKRKMGANNVFAYLSNIAKSVEKTGKCFVINVYTVDLDFTYRLSFRVIISLIFFFFFFHINIIDVIHLISIHW